MWGHCFLSKCDSIIIFTRDFLDLFEIHLNFILFLHHKKNLDDEQIGSAGSTLFSLLELILALLYHLLLNQHNDISCVKCNYSTRHKISFIPYTLSGFFCLNTSHSKCILVHYQKFEVTFFLADKRAIVHKNLNRYHTHTHKQSRCVSVS